jgi:beta-lactamase class C
VKSLVSWLKDWHPPQPGTRSYSNISIGLLGYITANALGMDYTKAAQSIVFPAFGLHHTFVDVPRGDMPQYAFGYDNKTNKPIRVTPGVLDAEAYGVKSNARDMLTVLDIEMGGGKASDELRKAIDRTHEGQYRTAYFTQDMVWEQYPWPAELPAMMTGNGYDYILKPNPVEKIVPPLPAQANVIINKTGSTSGFGGYLAMIPSKRLGVVVLANRNYPNDARVEATYKLIKSLLAD